MGIRKRLLLGRLTRPQRRNLSLRRRFQLPLSHLQLLIINLQYLLLFFPSLVLRQSNRRQPRFWKVSFSLYIRPICFCCQRKGKGKRIRIYSSSQIGERAKTLEELHKSVSPLEHKEEVENKEELREESTGMRLINLSKRFKELKCCRKASYVDAVQNVRIMDT